ncbi:MAG: FtsX-like permease family protein [Kiritimatiellia bacterium]
MADTATASRAAAPAGGLKGTIPEQSPLPWNMICRVASAGMKRRMTRSVMSISIVVLAIAFVAYMLIIDNITVSLVAVRDSRLAVLLQEKGVEVYGRTGTDEMTVLLISLALLTCTVGIVNSMLMSVTERVREIGTLKCLGARDLFIVKTYFVEATLQGIFGSICGMVLGVLVAVLVSMTDYPGYVLPNLPYGTIGRSLLLAFLAGLVISVIAAIAPAYAAARKQPVDALRVEE